MTKETDRGLAGDRSDMNPVLQEILESAHVTAPDGQRIPLHSHLPEREGRLLQYWLRQYRPSRLLEIGLAYGVSSLFICDTVSAWKTEHYHIIDAFQERDWHSIGMRHLADAGYNPLVTLYQQLSELCLPQLLEQGNRYDFAFVDGWHTFDQVLLEFYYLNRMLDAGGILIFDDMHLPSVQKVIAFVETCDCFQHLSRPDEFSNSLPIKVRKMMGLPPTRIEGFIKTGNDQRNWDWYRDF
jgi:predicted O-methyltransferase YrrM